MLSVGYVAQYLKSFVCTSIYRSAHLYIAQNKKFSVDYELFSDAGASSTSRLGLCLNVAKATLLEGSGQDDCTGDYSFRPHRIQAVHRCGLVQCPRCRT